MLEIDNIIFGLAVGCPIKECNINCPLVGIRKLSIRDRMAYILKLSPKEKNQIIDSHKLCIQHFEAKFPSQHITIRA